MSELTLVETRLLSQALPLNSPPKLFKLKPSSVLNHLTGTASFTRVRYLLKVLLPYLGGLPGQ